MNSATTTHSTQSEPGNLVVSSIENCRDLGGYPTSQGLTQPHRFLRSGNTGGVSPADAQLLRSWRLARVLDLRGPSEVMEYPDAFARMRGVRYKEIPLHNTNLHDPKLTPQQSEDTMDDFLTNGYLKMLGNRPAVRKIFKFFSHAKANQCVLYHCAAGMDRTGVVSMLLLGLVGTSRDCIRADYGYSFGPHEPVNQLVFGRPTFPEPRSIHGTTGANSSATDSAARKTSCQAETQVGSDAPVAKHASTSDHTSESNPLDGLDSGTLESLETLCELMGNVYDRLLDAYGSVEKYLLACGCKPRELDRVKAHLLEA